MAKQIWSVGATVKVGFLSMTIVAKVGTPGDHAPDVYHLVNAKGAKYTFQPHHGLTAGWNLGANEVTVSL